VEALITRPVFKNLDSVLRNAYRYLERHVLLAPTNPDQPEVSHLNPQPFGEGLLVYKRNALAVSHCASRPHHTHTHTHKKKGFIWTAWNKQEKQKMYTKFWLKYLGLLQEKGTHTSHRNSWYIFKM
jgi:hypothetical protein